MMLLDHYSLMFFKDLSVLIFGGRYNLELQLQSGHFGQTTIKIY